MAQIKITLATEAGELDSVTVQVTDEEDGIREALIAWLTDNCMVLADGDMIRIAELEG